MFCAGASLEALAGEYRFANFHICAAQAPAWRRWLSRRHTISANLNIKLNLCGAGAGLEALAGEAAQRALQLRGLAERGARARKKKALTDFLRALEASGASRRRSAVPAAERSVQAWFEQVRGLECAGTKFREYLAQRGARR